MRNLVRLFESLGSLFLDVVPARRAQSAHAGLAGLAGLPARIGVVPVVRVVCIGALACLACTVCVACAAQGDPLGGASLGQDAEPNLDVATDDTSIGGDAGAPVWPGSGNGNDASSGGLEAGAPDPSPSPSPAPPSPPGPPGPPGPDVDSGGDSTVDSSAALDAPSSFEPDASCIQPLGPAALAIDELMIESVSGTGDYGEWLEVRSMASCALNLNGLHGQCPVGAKLHTFDITSDTWLLPNGTFVVADVSDPAINHDLPSPVVTWAGQPGDVLRNLGGTVTLTVGDSSGTIVDSVTFPSLKPKVGASIAFPSNCPASRRTDWTAWQTSTASWFPGFFGTPNAPNDDVSCP